jgi:hypothetical protein
MLSIGERYGPDDLLASHGEQLGAIHSPKGCLTLPVAVDLNPDEAAIGFEKNET